MAGKKKSGALAEAAKIEKLLDDELRAMQKDALDRVSNLKGEPVTVHSLHGIIGGKNNDYVDAVRDRFSNPEDFLAKWVNGLVQRVSKANEWQLKVEGKITPDSTAAKRLATWLKDDLIRAYTFCFLRRNFYREFNARTRLKPPDDLWQVWFGGKNSMFGLLISPAWRNGLWDNDKSEMRREPYVYWTVGHVIATGFVSPNEESPMHFDTIKNFTDFYRHVLKKVSNSAYEKRVADHYLQYLSHSPDVLSEPVLLPEVQYGGMKVNHQYRLDYTVLNGHTMARTGFEISPHFSHGALKGIKGKTQKSLNEELKKQWEHEMAKRNAYFETYGIPTVTFTDSALLQFDQCWAKIASSLSERAIGQLVLSDEVSVLMKVM